MPRFEERGLQGRQRTVLVIEDEMVNREILCALLQSDYRVLQAQNGQEGLDQLRQHFEEISLIMLDIFMPVMDGFEFLRARQADERFANIPVIVATASERSSDELECLKLGANDFVRKPYDPDIIRKRVDNMIQLRETSSIVNQLRWDAITGLYRREFFHRRVDNLLEAFPDKVYDLVCGDIRNFRMLNERYGRERCDDLLHDLAAKLQATLPGVVTSGRVDADVFGFLIDHFDGDLTDVLDEAVKSMGFPHLYVRFGIVQDVDHALSAAQLCDRATAALSHQDGSTGAGVALYTDALRQQLEVERTIVGGMDSAFEECQFIVYYQPKHNARTGKVAGAEALVRWYHPELGLVHPSLFVPIFERNGMIARLDRYVFEEACNQIARLRDGGLPVVPISVNISPLDFDDPDLPTTICGIADRYGIDHALLHLELTETAYSDNPDTVVSALSQLRSYGFKIELDDFGTGYSSLALLNVLPIDILKIDGVMVRNATKLDDFRIIQSAIQIAHQLGLETIIEGVETGEALEHLMHLGSDFIQGFYYSWPLRQKDFEDYLANA